MTNIIKYRVFIIIGFSILLAISVWKIPTMKANYQFDDYFPQQDSTVTFYQNIEKEFGTAADFLLVAFENSPDVFDSSFLIKLDSFSNSLVRDSSVKRITGINNFQDVRKTPFGYIQKNTLSLPSNNYSKVKNRFLKDPRTKKILVNKKGTAVCLVIQTKRNIPAKTANELIEKIVSSSEKIGLSKPKIGGQIYTETTYVKVLEKENIKLIPIFILVVSIVLLLLYRSVIASLVPTISVMAGLVLLYGYAAWIGRDINISTLMYPTVMAVVGMSDLIHLYTKYQDELLKGFKKKMAIANSLSELRNTLFLTSLTTIIGFLSISFSDIPHIHTFGFDAAIGVALAFFIAIFLTPIILFYIPVRFINLKKRNWDQFLNKAYFISRDHPKYIIGGSMLMLFLGLFGMQKINTNNKILDAISEKSNLKKEFLFFENEFSGIRAMELVLIMKDGHQINEPKVLKDIDQIESYLNSLKPIGTVFSPTTFYKTIYDAQSGPMLSQYHLPEEDSKFKPLEKLSKRFKNPFVNKDLNKGLISARMTDVGRIKMQEINQELNAWVAKNLEDRNFKIHSTGRHALIDRTNELMIDSMFKGLLFALILISFIIAFLFRSLKIGIISLIPNIFPLILTAGVMGFLGIELNGSSAIIFTIAFVIAVDDTIHFLKKYAFLQKQKEQITKEALIHQTIMEAGKAILVTSIILISGYGVLLLSEFKEAYYHGVLICFTMFWAVLADLFLLPILLRKFG